MAFFFQHGYLYSWWFQPNLKKYVIVKLDHFPRIFGMNISKKKFELPPPSYTWLEPIGFVSDQIASSNLRLAPAPQPGKNRSPGNFCLLNTPWGNDVVTFW